MGAIQGGNILVATWLLVTGCGLSAEPGNSTNADHAVTERAEGPASDPGVMKKRPSDPVAARASFARFLAKLRARDQELVKRLQVSEAKADELSAMLGEYRNARARLVQELDENPDADEEEMVARPQFAAADARANEHRIQALLGEAKFAEYLQLVHTRKDSAKSHDEAPTPLAVATTNDALLVTAKRREAGR